MPFYDELVTATQAGRQDFIATPVVQRALAGRVTREEYVDFLGQAFHHVRHTVPLLMACGSRLPDRLGWLRDAAAEYIDEELGHERWILDDIAAADGDPAAAEHAGPMPATELMVAYAYHVIDRVNPVGFFGMVFVLEGMSVALATRAAEAIRDQLALPAGAFRYLTSHGAVDQQHVRFLEQLMNRVDHPSDRACVVHCATRFYRLYGDIFNAISRQ